MKHVFAVLVYIFSTGIAHAGHLNATLDDLLLLADSGVSDRTILAFIEPRELNFTLDAKEIAKLRKAGFSDEVIQYLLAKSKQADLDNDQFIEPPASYSYPDYYYGSSLAYAYPGYYYGPSLYLGFGGGHHALFDHHFVGQRHTAPHHTGPYHDTSIHVAHSGSAAGHHDGHTSQFAAGSVGIYSTSSSAHTAGRNISRGSSHDTNGISTLSSRHNSNSSHGILGRSSHNTSGISALSSRHSSNRGHSALGRSSHNTTSSKTLGTNHSSNNSSRSGGHGGRGHGGGGHSGGGHGGGH